MPDLAPAFQPQPVAAPAPIRGATSGGPAPITTPAPVPISSGAPAPNSPGGDVPAPRAKEGTIEGETARLVAPAPRPTETIAAPVSLSSAAIAPAPIAKASGVPISPLERPKPPATFFRQAPDTVAPVAENTLLSFATLARALQWANALQEVEFDPMQSISMQPVIIAISLAKKQVEQTGGRFSWSRLSTDPTVPFGDLAALAQLTESVFDKDKASEFDTSTLFEDAWNALPKSVIETASRLGEMHLEGVWVEFPLPKWPNDQEAEANQNKDIVRPRLAIAVSLALPTSGQPDTPAINRVYLKFGDF